MKLFLNKLTHLVFCGFHKTRYKAEQRASEAQSKVKSVRLGRYFNFILHDCPEGYTDIDDIDEIDKFMKKNGFSIYAWTFNIDECVRKYEETFGNKQNDKIQ